MDRSFKLLNSIAEEFGENPSNKFQKKLEEIIAYILEIINAIIRPFKGFYQKIHNIVRWMPILWKDRDWDYVYIYDILSFKLKNQANHIRKHSNHVSAKHDADQMMLCVNLIQKISENYYNMEYMDYGLDVNESQPPSVDSYGEYYITSFQWETEKKFGTYEDFINKHKAAYRNMVKDRDFLEYHKSFDISNIKLTAMYLSEYNQLRAKRLLFKIMETYIEGWWD